MEAKVLKPGYVNFSTYHYKGQHKIEGFIAINPSIHLIQIFYDLSMTSRYERGEITSDPYLSGYYDGIALRATRDIDGNIYIGDAWQMTHGCLMHVIEEFGQISSRDRLRYDKNGYPHDMGQYFNPENQKTQSKNQIMPPWFGTISKDIEKLIEPLNEDEIFRMTNKLYQFYSSLSAEPAMGQTY